jgi:hypothetical protein
MRRRTWAGVLGATMVAACTGADADVATSTGTSTGGPGQEGTSTSSSGPGPDGSGDTGTVAGTTAGPGDETVDDTGPPVEPGATWHIESPADSARTWLVSPTGERVYWLGVNTVMRDKECDGILDYLRRDEPTVTANVEWARMSDGESAGHSVPQPYCFNSVGAFSDTNEFDDGGGDSWMIRPAVDGGAGAPYSVVLPVVPGGDDRALRTAAGTVLEAGFTRSRVGDPWNPAFVEDLEMMAAERVAPRADDPGLQFWFAGNEIGMFDRGGKGHAGVRDFRRFLWSDCPAGSTPERPRCAPHALVAFLLERHGTVAALEAAWELDVANDDLVQLVEVGPRPVPYQPGCNLACREDLQRFVHDRLLRRWVEVVTTAIRQADPNHLVASPRFALSTSASYRFYTPASEAGSDVWFDTPNREVPTDTADVIYCPYDLLGRDGDTGFDVIAVNVYSGDPTFEDPWLPAGLTKLHERSGVPVIVSEFSVRARIDGWSNRGGAGSFVPHDDATDDQIQRGAYYREQIDQLTRLPFVLGASWHAWSDRYLAADEAHQIDMGLVRCEVPGHGHVAGERWPEIDDRIADTNCAIMDRIAENTGL